MKRRMIFSILVVTSSFLVASGSAVYAQCAGCGANYNKADRAQTAREGNYQRMERVDPGIRPDPVGNGILGGGAAGVAKGVAAGAASGVVTGATSIVTGVARGGAMEKLHEHQQNKK